MVVVGNLGKDPELRYPAEGVPVTTFSVASNRKWTVSDGTPGEETTAQLSEIRTDMPFE